MKKRRLIIFLCILFTLFLTVAPCAQATPYVYVEMTGASLEFEKCRLTGEDNDHLLFLSQSHFRGLLPFRSHYREI